MQPSAEDEGGAETALVPQQDEVLVAACRAQALLGDGGEIDVVLVLDRHRQGRGEIVEQRGGVPAGQVGGVAQTTGGGVEGAGGGDDQPPYLVTGEARGLHGAVEGVGDLPYDGVGGLPAGCGHLERAHGAAGGVGDGGQDAFGGDIEPRGVRGGRIHLVQLGVGTGAPLGGAGREHQSRRLQPGQQL